MAKLEKVTGVFDLIKIENTVFVLPFTYIGMLLAGSLSLSVFLLITIALICARGAAFCANRYVGREIDSQNPKKKNWKNVALYSKTEILLLFFLFAIIFEASAYLLNLLSAILAPLVLIIVILEPYTKRYTSHRHLIMGLVIGLGILGGYVGASGTIPMYIAPYVLLLAYMSFSAANDVIYSISHVDFDKAHGLKTYPVKYGVRLSKQISKYLHYWSSALFIEFGSLVGSTNITATGVLTLIIFFFEHRNLLEKSEKSIAATFFYYNALVSLLMLAAMILTIKQI